MSLPVIDITCTERNVTKKADILDLSRTTLKVVPQGSDVVIMMRKKRDV